MNDTLQAIAIADDIYWVGAIDWNIRDFHGYLTSHGTTYNAFLIMADKVTLVDTVRRPFFDEMMARIASVVDPGRIDYVISNHAEMDHSGSLAQACSALNPEKVFASKFGVKALAKHFDLPQQVSEVADGEAFSLGNMNLHFVETRMVHWPDSMVSYLPERELLFSQDAFGMHLATTERFDDEVDDWVLEYEAAKYYANILTPLSTVIGKALAKLLELNLPLKMIAPDHGPIWRDDPARIIKLYADWVQMRPTRKAVIIYDTMWHSTELMAGAYAEGLRAGGACVRQMRLNVTHRSDVATELLEAGALVVGTPTLNSNMFPTVADSLTYLRGLNRPNLIGSAFGSHGWSGEATRQVLQIMEDMHVKIVADPVKVQFVPTEEELRQCFEAGKQIGEALAEWCS